MLEDRRDALRQLLGDPDPQIKQAAAEALDALEAVAQFDRLLEGLKSKDRGERIAAVYALERVASAKVFPPLLEALQSSDPDLRSLAVQVLGRKRHPKTLGPLVKMLDDPEAAVRAETARALAEFADRRLPEQLAKLTVSYEEEEVVLAALAGLGKLAFPEGEAPLIAALKDSRPRVRRLAAQMLGKLQL